MTAGTRVLACAMAAWLGGCYGSGSANSDAGVERASDRCEPGDTGVCTCDSGFRNTAQCGADGSWLPCPCADFGCSAGETRPCNCPGGLSGTQYCTDTGALLECVCESLLPPADPQPPAGDPGTVVYEPQDEAAFLWDDAALHTFDIELDPQDLLAIDASPAAELYVEGKLTFDGTTHGPVGVRYKGSYGAFLAPCTADQLGELGGARVGKCSIKVSFNWLDPEQRFFGLKKLQFHSLGHDASMMRERLGYAMFREMDVPAPRAVHVRLRINGKFVGLYGLIEQIDGRFARAHFSEGGTGNLYKEVWPVHANPDVYVAALKTNRDEMPSVQQMLDFRAAVEQGSELALRWLDVDMTMRYLAVDRVLVNDDGIMHFWCTAGGQGANPGPFGNHNYYWYFADNSTRAWLIPWDLDSSMKPDGFVQVYTPWSVQPQQCGCQSYPQQQFPIPQAPPGCDPLIAAWASRLDLYNAQVDAFVTGPFSAAAIDAKLDAWASLIRVAVAEQEAAGIIAVDSGVLSVEQWDYAVQRLRTDLDYIRDNRGYPY